MSHDTNNLLQVKIRKYDPSLEDSTSDDSITEIKVVPRKDKSKKYLKTPKKDKNDSPLKQQQVSQESSSNKDKSTMEPLIRKSTPCPASVARKRMRLSEKQTEASKQGSPNTSASITSISALDTSISAASENSKPEPNRQTGAKECGNFTLEARPLPQSVKRSTSSNETKDISKQQNKSDGPDHAVSAKTIKAFEIQKKKPENNKTSNKSVDITSQPDDLVKSAKTDVLSEAEKLMQEAILRQIDSLISSQNAFIHAVKNAFESLGKIKDKHYKNNLKKKLDVSNGMIKSILD